MASTTMFSRNFAAEEQASREFVHIATTLTKLKVPELKEILREIHGRVNGRKAELIERIRREASNYLAGVKHASINFYDVQLQLNSQKLTSIYAAVTRFSKTYIWHIRSGSNDSNSGNNGSSFMDFEMVAAAAAASLPPNLDGMAGSTNSSSSLVSSLVDLSPSKTPAAALLPAPVAEAPVDCFHEVVHVLMPPNRIPVSHRVQTITHRRLSVAFKVHGGQVAAVMGSKASSNTVLLWAYKLQDPQRTPCWPLETTLSINGQEQTIRQRRLVKEGLNERKPKGFSAPLEVPLALLKVNQENRLMLSCTNGVKDRREEYVVLCQVVRKLSVEALTRRLTDAPVPSSSSSSSLLTQAVAPKGSAHRLSRLEALNGVRATFGLKPLSSEQFSEAAGRGNSSNSSKICNENDNDDDDNDDDDNDDVVASATRLSLRCPIGLVPIQIPVRGRACRHLQCFDLETFLRLNTRPNVGRFRCGVCSNILSSPCSDVVIDSFIENILKASRGGRRSGSAWSCISVDEASNQTQPSSSEEATPLDVEILPDASWRVISEEENAKSQASSEANERKAKRRKLTSSLADASPTPTPISSLAAKASSVSSSSSSSCSLSTASTGAPPGTMIDLSLDSDDDD